MEEKVIEIETISPEDILSESGIGAQDNMQKEEAKEEITKSDMPDSTSQKGRIDYLKFVILYKIKKY